MDRGRRREHQQGAGSWGEHQRAEAPLVVGPATTARRVQWRRGRRSADAPADVNVDLVLARGGLIAHQVQHLRGRRQGRARAARVRRGQAPGAGRRTRRAAGAVGADARAPPAPLHVRPPPSAPCPAPCAQLARHLRVRLQLAQALGRQLLIRRRQLDKVAAAKRRGRRISRGGEQAGRQAGGSWRGAAGLGWAGLRCPPARPPALQTQELPQHSSGAARPATAGAVAMRAWGGR